MYPVLLTIHSLFRWLVLASLLFSIYLSYRGWFKNKIYSKSDNFIRHSTATVVQIQWCIGISLYFLSPVVEFFLNNFKEAVHQREFRFFGMEHSLMMFVAVVIISIGSGRAKRETSDLRKFKTAAIWFTIGFLIIMSSIPWGFPPLVSRPFLRSF